MLTLDRRAFLLMLPGFLQGRVIMRIAMSRAIPPKEASPTPLPAAAARTRMVRQRAIKPVTMKKTPSMRSPTSIQSDLDIATGLRAAERCG